MRIFVPAMTEGSNECSKGAEHSTTNGEPVRRSNAFNKTETIKDNTSKEDDFHPKIRWPDFTVQLFIHLGCLYGLLLCLVSARFYTTLLVSCKTFFFSFRCQKIIFSCSKKNIFFFI
jgi:hypothetical protein